MATSHADASYGAHAAPQLRPSASPLGSPSGFGSSANAAAAAAAATSSGGVTSPHRVGGGRSSVVAGGGGGIGASTPSATDDTAPVLPLNRNASAGAALSVRQAYQSRTSPLYIICLLSIIAAVSYLGFYRVALVGREHHEELKVNMRPPWALFRWLGSLGVDVTDMQCYFFVVAIPPAMPYLIAFIFISRRLRRNAASKAAAAVVAVRDGGAGAAAAATAGEGGFESGPGRGVSLVTRKDVSSVHIFHIFSGMLIALCLCGPGILFGLALMLVNFYLVAPLHKVVSFRVCMAVMWSLHIAVLFINYHADGYRFAWFGLSFLDDLWMPLIKWNTQYNMTVLRLISFNNDLWESVSCGEERRQKALEKHARTCVACAQIRDQHRHALTSLPPEALSCYKCRTECPRRVEEFTLGAYLGYIFYLPLFMAGPLSSFNAYVSYQHYAARSMTGAAVWRYGLRFLSHAVGLATMLHYVPIMAILLTPAATAPAGGQGAVAAAASSTTPSVTESATPLVRTLYALAVAVTPDGVAGARAGAHTSTMTMTAAPWSAGAVAGGSVLDRMHFTDKSCLFFLTLAFIWAKFDVIWRFFRFFALLDGFDPPEDMPRCFANTVNIQSFWRDWHASFNLWIVRYMYIPMGGNRHKFLTIFPIFFFIAIWHDIELRLLFWALFICIGFIPEIAVTLFFASKRNPLVLRLKRSPVLWRHLRVFGTQLCMIELMVANLIGFSVGTSGAETGVRQLFSGVSTLYKICAPYFFWCAANIAVQDRDQKAYEQLQLKIKYGLQ